ncbi:MAG: YwaF family protein [Lachnospiraceae bacterium]|nr:YwaF family protein [Lachnospiraceae bacterium]
MSFFTYQWDLPKGSGYPIWGREYFIQIGITAALILLFRLLYQKLSKKARDRVRLLIPIFMFCMEASKQTLLLFQGNSNVGAYPLHMCSFGAIVFFLTEVSGHGKGKISCFIHHFFGEAAVMLMMPGSAIALSMVDWTMYPVFNYFNIYGYIWHGLLVLYPILLLSEKDIHPTIRHIHYDIAFLLMTGLPVLAFDKKYDCNFMFVNWPIHHTPLMKIYSLTGPKFYLLGYLVLIIVVVLILNMGVEIIRFIYKSTHK